RRPRDEAQALLVREAVHLVDDAVDVVGKARALRTGLAIEVEEPFGALHGSAVARDDESHRVEGIEELRMRRRQLVALERSHAVREEGELALRREPRVELPQPSGRGVARVDEGALAELGRAPV